MLRSAIVSVVDYVPVGRGSIAILTALAGVLLVACDGASEATEGAVYVGAVRDRDGDLSIALAVQGEWVTAYVCADEPTGEKYPGWFIGAAPLDGRIRFDRDGWSLSASWTREGAEGTLGEPDGTPLAWSAPIVRGQTLTGLYAAAEPDATAGVIVLEDPGSRAPLVRGAWRSADDLVLQVTPIFPIELIDERLAVEVALPAGPRRFYVARLGASQ